MKPVPYCLLVPQRLVPGMVRQCIFGMMYGDQFLRAQVQRLLAQLPWHGVQVGPVFVILPVFKDGEVDVADYTYVLNLMADQE